MLLIFISSKHNEFLSNCHNNTGEGGDWKPLSSVHAVVGLLCHHIISYVVCWMLYHSAFRSSSVVFLEWPHTSTLMTTQSQRRLCYKTRDKMVILAMLFTYYLLSIIVNKNQPWCFWQYYIISYRIISYNIYHGRSLSSHVSFYWMMGQCVHVSFDGNLEEEKNRVHHPLPRTRRFPGGWGPPTKRCTMLHSKSLSCMAQHEYDLNFPTLLE